MRLSCGTLVSVAVVALSLGSAEGLAAKCSPQMAWPGLERGVPVLIVDGSIMVPEMRAGNEAPAFGGLVEGPAPLPPTSFVPQRAQSGSAINIRGFTPVVFDWHWPDAINDPSVIHSIEITCWNPKTGEIGGGGGLNVFRILTKSFVESTRAPIEALLRAQEAYFSQHSRYAQSLDDLVGFGVPRDAMLEFSATSTGWSATTPRDDVDNRCFVYSGSAVPAVFGMKEHEIVCQPETARVSRALREVYEGSG